MGVLFDLLADGELPWSLTVHFTGFPEAQVMRLASQNAPMNLRSFFMNSLKESTYVKQNGIKVINDFGIKESDTIWDGLYAGQFDIFWSIANLISHQSSPTLPIRVLRPNFPIMQYPVPNTDPSTGAVSTLQTALTRLGSNAKPVIQGIQPPSDTPLLWLSQHLAHPDGFLYIVLKD